MQKTVLFVQTAVICKQSFIRLLMAYESMQQTLVLQSVHAKKADQPAE